MDDKRIDDPLSADGSGATRTTTEARQGRTTGGRVRWMLGAGLALVVIGFIVAYLMV